MSLCSIILCVSNDIRVIARVGLSSCVSLDAAVSLSTGVSADVHSTETGGLTAGVTVHIDISLGVSSIEMAFSAKHKRAHEFK